MALDGVKNFAIVTVSTGYDDTATSIVLAGSEGAKLPDPATANYNLVWWDSTNYSEPALDPKVEIVRCTAKSTDTLTVTRAQESTTAQTKNTGGATYKMALTVTAKTITDIETELDGKKTDNVSATSRVLGRKTAGSGVIEELTLSEIMDFIGSAAEGDILYRGASAWARLGKGSDGQVLTLASGLPSWAAASGGGASVIIKASDETVNNSNTLQDDNDFSIAIGTSETYEFKLVIYFYNTTPSAGFKWQITQPVDAAYRYMWQMYSSSGADSTTVLKSYVKGVTNEVALTTDYAVNVLIIEGTVVNSTNAGNITFQFCQNSATAANTTVTARSKLIYRKVS